MSTADTLRRAADHMEKVGLNQDGHYYALDDPEAPRPPSQRPCCTIGAIQTVEEDRTEQRRAATEVARTLGHGGRYAHDAIVTWNDAPATTQEQVLATLRTTADRVEAQK